MTRRAALLIACLAGCADEPFTYSVDLPPSHTIAGFEGESRVELTFDSYERARTELSLVVSRDTIERELGTPLEEHIRIGNGDSDPTAIYIDLRTCVGTSTSRTIIDCGC